MPPKSKIANLPPDVRKELERRIVEQEFEGHDQLAVWLQEQGHDINENNVYRHAVKLKEYIEDNSPILDRFKEELERSGIVFTCDSQELTRLLLELGAIRLRERIVLAHIAAVSNVQPV